MDNVLTYKNYRELRQGLQAKKCLFEDKSFPAVDESIFYSQKPPRSFEWKRPHEICDDPNLFVGGASRFDIAQGELGDCWFLAALASLSLDEYLLKKVVPDDDQDFGSRYCGAFHFHFWQYGQWIEVIIDDRLPTFNGRLVFVHSTEKNEFWSALMEKAYAKLHGSYESLKGGNTTEAMVDFTGGFTESHDLKKAPKNLFKIMMDAYNHDSQMGCSLDANPNEIEAKLNNGLIKGHAYTITDVRRVKVSGRGPKGIQLIRIRNPWGQKEWNGRWSDDSSEWKNIPNSERQRLGLVTVDDGEFWMEFCDFVREYNRVDICHLQTNTAGKKKKWAINEIDGRWQKHLSAGGCRNFPDTFFVNPQIELTLRDLDDDDDDDDDEDDPAAKQKGCTVMIGLLQKNRRKQMKMGVGNLTVGFAVYEYKDDKIQKLPKDYFLYNASKARSHTFINTREIMGRFKLPPGRYCIIPSTFEPNQEGDFLIRLYTMKDVVAGTLDERTGTVDTPKGPAPPVPSDKKSVEKKTPDDLAKEDNLKKQFYETFKKLTGDSRERLRISGQSSHGSAESSPSDMEIDAWELQDIMNSALQKELGKGKVGIENCKAMVASCDADRSGKLGFEEFMGLWMDIKNWKKIFVKYDKDRSGSFNTIELREALHEIGYTVSSKTLGPIVLRFANRHGNINIDDFLMIAVKLKHLFGSFDRRKTHGGLAQYSLDEFLAVTMYS